ncbi:MAG: type IV pilus twitching motility protein PilT [Patescibacteria group bacterium]|jgi:twitching motility protein PilT
MTLENLFLKAVENGASDLHLVAGLPPYVRVDGQLKPLDKKALSAKEIELMIKGVIDENRQKKFAVEKELDFAYESSDKSRFRINLHFEKGNMGLSARTIPPEIPTMEDINMPQVAFDLCNMDGGLILVTGPTGCGKSTSLAAMIDYINQSRSLNIITLEDPIEFIFTPNKSIIRQRQLGTDMTSFQNGLVHALRQDPNVIMVGEMRDLDTIATTITLAETGHLVFATLHTYSASQTIDRIIDIFPPHQQNQVRMQVSMTLKGIIAQKLLPREGGGRVAAREVLINDPAVSNLIRENKVSQIKTAIQTSSKDGMISMDNSLQKLYKEGSISKAVLDSNISSGRI